MNISISVRDAALSDLDTIVDFNRRLAGESEGKSLDRRILTEGVQRGLETPELCRYFVAEADGRVVATTMLTYEFTDWRCGVLWWLQSVFVDPDYRRRGVFRAMYRHIETLARSTQRVRGLRLYVKHDNTKAQGTYAALGMIPSGYDVYECDWSGAVADAE